MSAPPKHRQAIIDAAVELFRRRGYSATGLQDIVALSGAPKGSVYHYFPGGKAAIAAEAVREAGRRVAQTVALLAASAATAGDLIKAHAGLLAQWMAQSDYRDGSPMTTILLENAPHDRAITAAGKAALGDWRAIIAAKLVADGLPPERAARLASLAMAALEGALIQTRVEESATPVLTVADELDHLLRQAVQL